MEGQTNYQYFVHRWKDRQTQMDRQTERPIPVYPWNSFAEVKLIRKN